eukprot:CAMPEP_0201687234 /NCGR_PEP_ID=MMETSP0578-20130828/1383_1 /ASSEMBLY_ACC=CAM_ASM_000663 /TAXON_ID=267565 /ORGANISM="Skeletonema grethea, Strain CCMP 1804" /LENGTH=696 /DNA_ID=CAMNT_0048171375 /DNA_START=120 /DNA_END=2210 /DNA_ORIENTATION=-
MNRPPRNDEEAPLIVEGHTSPINHALPPQEISFRSQYQHRCSFTNDDGNHTVQSELSTLMPSTLTPNYNPDDIMHCHSDPSGSSSAISSKKAFRLAAFLAALSIAALGSVDLNYFVGVRNHEAETKRLNHLSHAETDVSALPVERSAEESVKSPKSNKKKKKKKKKQKKQTKDDDEQDDDGDEESAVLETEGDDAKEVVNSQDADLDSFVLVDSPSSATKKSREVQIPTPAKRCDYVIDTFEQQNEGSDQDFLREKYKVQSADPNVFYRATALVFWQDFGTGMWGKDQNKSVVLDDLVMLSDATYEDGTPMSPSSAWTWVTGDQHLSNFGAFRNRAKEVVFSVNDFDEAAIYDFHIDVLRIAVSIASHGFTNGLSLEQVQGSLQAFAYMYVKTVVNYVGNDRALVYELTRYTSTGVLRDFLEDDENKKSKSAQIEKFTELAQDGRRRFTRDSKTRLVDVPAEIYGKIRAAFTSTTYGASMMKMGWKVRGWDDDFFEILDIARRLGSGIGSFGVDRFYVLLKGKDELLHGDMDVDNSQVILDVKYEPTSAVSRILDEDTSAWYAAKFQSEADRVAQAQVALTSYTDPYVGYIYIDGDSYNVRQRSAYKNSIDIDSIKDHRAFDEYIEQIAIATATAHVRGSVSKSPGQFKHSIKSLLAGDRNRSRWSKLVTQIALSYREQVLLDFDCFEDYVKNNYS